MDSTLVYTFDRHSPRFAQLMTSLHISLQVISGLHTFSHTVPVALHTISSTSGVRSVFYKQEPGSEPGFITTWNQVAGHIKSTVGATSGLQAGSLRPLFLGVKCKHLFHWEKPLVPFFVPA